MPHTSIAGPIRRRPVRDTNYVTWLGKQRLYSLTRVLKDLGLKPDFSEVNPAVMRRAACRGKLVEDYAYRMLEYRRGVTVRARHCGSLQPDVKLRVEAFYRWMQAYNPQFVDAQTYVWSEHDRVSWKRDLRVIIRGALWLIDIKCTSKQEKDWPLQLGCGLAYDENGCDQAAILHLNPKYKTGYRFIHDWNARQLKDWWYRTIDRWHSDYDFNKLRAELGYESEARGFEIEEDE